jgi:hypothetical protein
MTLGSEARKALFCRSFLESHLIYDPQPLAWPQRDDSAPNRRRGILFWQAALATEGWAGARVAGQGGD